MGNKENYTILDASSSDRDLAAGVLRFKQEVTGNRISEENIRKEMEDTKRNFTEEDIQYVIARVHAT